MTINRPVSTVEVESEFLRAEWYKDFFDPVRNKLETVVFDTDYTNEDNNRIRKNLIWQYRLPVLQNLPQDIHWYGVSLSQAEFGEIMIIRETGWEKTFGSAKKLKEVAAAISNNIGDQGVGFKLIKDIKTNIGTHPFKEKILIISDAVNKPSSIVEGNHRAVAFQMKVDETNDGSHLPSELLLGISPNMVKSPWLNK